MALGEGSGLSGHVRRQLAENFLVLLKQDFLAKFRREG